MSNIILNIFFQNCKNVQNLVIFGNQSNVEKLSLNEALVMTERLESFISSEVPQVWVDLNKVKNALIDLKSRMKSLIQSQITDYFKSN